MRPRSIGEYVHSIFNAESTSTELDTALAIGIDDDYFISQLDIAFDNKEDEHPFYLLTSAFIKVALRNNRIKLATYVFNNGLERLKDSKNSDEYIQGIATSALRPSITRGQTKFALKIIKALSKEVTSNWLTVDSFHDATYLENSQAIKITNALSKAVDSDKFTLSTPLYFAAKNKEKWQADILINHGADIGILSEEEVRWLLGPPKKAVLSLPEERLHLLEKLFYRYIKRSKAEPFDYLCHCPQWQQPYILSIIEENTL